MSAPIYVAAPSYGNPDVYILKKFASVAAAKRWLGPLELGSTIFSTAWEALHFATTHELLACTALPAPLHGRTNADGIEITAWHRGA
jgi:hypothetical protein